MKYSEFTSISDYIKYKDVIFEDEFKSFFFSIIPKIEKLIVDIFDDKFLKILFSDEILNIYINLLRNYQINFATVFRYARKKHCYDELVNYLDHIGFDIEKGEFR